MSDASGRTIEAVACAVDFSDTANLAWARARELARRHHAGLVLCHAVEPLPVASYPIGIVPTTADVELRKFAVERLEGMASEARRSGLAVQTVVENGPPGPTLVEAAEREHADVLVIGTRGLAGLEHLLLGSTAETVVRLARCPILTVHPQDDASGEPVRTVVMPTDLGPDAAEAVEAFARLFPDTEETRVVLAFADSTPPYLEPFRHEALERWGEADSRGEEIEERMQPIAARLEAAGFRVEREVLDGGPVGGVTDLARDRDADLIVLATRRRSALTNLLVGRIAQRIVQYAPCPVLTVPVSKQAAEEAG